MGENAALSRLLMAKADRATEELEENAVALAYIAGLLDGFTGRDGDIYGRADEAAVWDFEHTGIQRRAVRDDGVHADVRARAI